MSGFLLDTNVISMSVPDRRVDERFTNWLRLQEAADTLFISVVTVHELTKGIALLEKKGATAKAAQLLDWLDVLISEFGDRILAFDTATASIGGEIEAASLSEGHTVGMADAMIAATAKLHNLVVVTQNTKHFDLFPLNVRTPAELAV